MGTYLQRVATVIGIRQGAKTRYRDLLHTQHSI